MFRFLYPHYRVNSVLELTGEWLIQQEIFTIFLDVDNTIKFYKSTLVTSDVVDWIHELQRNHIQFYLVSNGLSKRISHVAEQLGLEYAAPAYKPFPYVCRRLMCHEKLDPQYVAMVGDQVFTDVIAGNLAGIRTILVKPMRPEQEPFFTRMKRPFEQWVLKLERSEYSEQ
ncbi:MAG: YqeG family HAD IIIA-type phosphatase [Planctomycetaceae bacterium]|jgi:HAD superfamily phosphatase (TIGR01668 family)|nr:YqeG family HAD IIIA-type phosphatase [Planctomycetaceae bacterium]